MKIATLDMNARELARSDIAGGFEAHLESARKFNSTPSAVESVAKLWISQVRRKLDALGARVEFDRMLSKLENAPGAEGKAVALSARLELLDAQLDAAACASKPLKMETLADVLDGQG